MIATTTTTRCRLPLPIGAPVQEQITATIANWQAEDTSCDLVKVELLVGSQGGHSITSTFIGERNGPLLDQDGGTVMFPSLAVAIAHMMLEQIGADYLRLETSLATSWAGFARPYAEPEPREQWWRRPEAERAAIIAADDAAELARAERAHTILDVALHERTGNGLDEILAASRPFDPAVGRYLDGAHEYNDGSAAGDLP